MVSEFEKLLEREREKSIFTPEGILKEEFRGGGGTPPTRPTGPSPAQIREAEEKARLEEEIKKRQLQAEIEKRQAETRAEEKRIEVKQKAVKERAIKRREIGGREQALADINRQIQLEQNKKVREANERLNQDLREGRNREIVLANFQRDITEAQLEAQQKRRQAGISIVTPPPERAEGIELIAGGREQAVERFITRRGEEITEAKERETEAPGIEEERAKPFLTVEAVKIPKTFLGKIMFNLQRQRQEFKPKFGGIETGGKTFDILKQQAGGFVIGLGISAVSFAQFIKQLGTQPITTVKGVIKGIPQIPEKLGEFGTIIKEEPGLATGLIIGEVIQDIALGKVALKVIDLGDVARTRISPGFKGIIRTGFGEDILKGVVGKTDDFDIGLIPRGTPGSVLRNLDIDVLRAIEETKIPIKARPKLPPLTKAQRKIIQSLNLDEAITGSLGQRILLQKRFTRQFGDIDIVSPDIFKTARRLKAKLGEDFKFTTKRITDSPAGTFDIVRIKKKGKLLADIDPIKFAEEGLARQFGTIDIDGLRVVKPEARLGAKLTQLQRGKLGAERKVLTDIELLTGGQIDFKSPLLKGAFGFSEAELRRSFGRTGTITTSAQNLFGGFFSGSRKQVQLSSDLFVSLPDLKSGQALTRKSFLEVGETGSLLDVLRGQADITFRRPKPQIVFLEDVRIGIDTAGRRLTAGEFEDIIESGKIIKRTGEKQATIFGGRRVEIIGAEIVEQSQDLQKLLKESADISITSKSSSKLINQLTKETGFNLDDIARAVSEAGTKQLRISPTGLGLGVSATISKTSIPKTKISLSLSRAKISKAVSIGDFEFEDDVVLSGASDFISERGLSKPSRGIIPRFPLGISRVARGERRPPPPTPEPVGAEIVEELGEESAGKIIPIISGLRSQIARERAKQQSFDVWIKSTKGKKRFIKANKNPLGLSRARDVRNFLLDNTLSRSGKLTPNKNPPKNSLLDIPFGYGEISQHKFRDFKQVKGKRIKLEPEFVVEKNKFVGDTRGEINDLNIEKAIKDLQKKQKQPLIFEDLDSNLISQKRKKQRRTKDILNVIP